jgi:hypothetical protein
MINTARENTLFNVHSPSGYLQTVGKMVTVTSFSSTDRVPYQQQRGAMRLQNCRRQGCLRQAYRDVFTACFLSVWFRAAPSE